jgi:hypothetical protein
MPELTNIATGREPRPQEVDKFRDAFLGQWRNSGDRGGQRDGDIARTFSGDPEVQKAAAEFDNAQKLEEAFPKDFEGKTLPAAAGFCFQSVVRLIFQHWILFSRRFGKCNLGQGNKFRETFSQRLINEPEDCLSRDFGFKPNLCDSLDKRAGRNLNGQFHKCIL